LADSQEAVEIISSVLWDVVQEMEDVDSVEDMISDVNYNALAKGFQKKVRHCLEMLNSRNTYITDDV